ncbi:uncharacterized protein [Spinacia oleracea]|uniref:Uncharacterized protein isoform X3 n=1 Tax=Spinacia oleracea TaxID=3562 RepID=A0ABM3RV51_SPIOL|nr:uncharacterized protein LOC110785987 isoform X3 [Spinacia oleracea]
MGEDRSCMYLPRRLPEYENGVIEFLNASFSKAATGGQIRRPCKRCKNRYWYRRNDVYNHLKGDGFVDNYYVWNFHGEESSTMKYVEDELNMVDDFNELLHDRFRNVVQEPSREQGPNDDAKTFYKLMDEGNQELYPGCKGFSILSFFIRLFLYKTLYGLSNVAIDGLLQFIKEIIPEAKVPNNFNAARKTVGDLGFGYKKNTCLSKSLYSLLERI